MPAQADGGQPESTSYPRRSLSSAQANPGLDPASILRLISLNTSAPIQPLFTSSPISPTSLSDDEDEEEPTRDAAIGHLRNRVEDRERIGVRRMVLDDPLHAGDTDSDSGDGSDEEGLGGRGRRDEMLDDDGMELEYEEEEEEEEEEELREVQDVRLATTLGRGTDQRRPAPVAGLVADEDLLRAMRLVTDGIGGTTVPVAPGTSGGGAGPSTYWPGLLGTTPLNPPSSTPFPSMRFDPHSRLLPPNPILNIDPPSATSPSSFLRPGVVFTGQQIFVKRRVGPRTSFPSASTYRPPGAQPSSLLGFTPPPPLYPSNPLPTSQPPRHGSTPADDFRAAEARVRHSRITPDPELDDLYSRLLAPSDPDLPFSSSRARARNARDALEVRNSFARLTRREFPATVVPLLTLDETRTRNAASSTAILERFRREIEALHPRFSGLSDEDVTAYDELSEQLDGMDRRAGLYGNGRAAESTTWSRETPAEVLKEGETSDEHWAVRVVIYSYNPEEQSLTGLMHALGVPDSRAQVTTSFRGTIIDPSSEGIFTRKWGAKKADDVDHWARLGPFKSLPKEELAAHVHDPAWMRERTKGYILMRWKETDFINVTPAESTLSISGFYLISLDRSNGSLEGLYYDPASSPFGSPFQRLILSAATPTSPYSLGTFGTR